MQEDNTITLYTLVTQEPLNHTNFTSAQDAAEAIVTEAQRLLPPEDETLSQAKDALDNGNPGWAITLARQAADPIADKCYITSEQIPVLSAKEQYEASTAEHPIRIDPYGMDDLAQEIQQYFTDAVAIAVQDGHPPEINSDRIQFTDTPELYVVPFGVDEDTVSHWKLMESSWQDNNHDPANDTVVGRYDTPMEAVVSGMARQITKLIAQEQNEQEDASITP
jgi:hypothetical protein